MKIVILIVFISLAVTYYINLHLQRRRDEKNLAHHEKRKDAYIDLLNKLKEKDTAEDNPEKKDSL